MNLIFSALPQTETISQTVREVEGTTVVCRLERYHGGDDGSHYFRRVVVGDGTHQGDSFGPTWAMAYREAMMLLRWERRAARLGDARGPRELGV